MGKKKTKKYRGSRSHGRGTKAGRGAGERGGRGKAGLNKHKVKSMVKDDPNYFGPKGFTRPQGLTEETEVINIYQVEENLDQLVEAGIATEEGDGYEVDLEKAGFDKLLSKGRATKQMKIKVSSFSDNAEKKIEDAGGEIISE
ncbi:MAG: uL15m family ribosomal protein [Thermoplasmatota archaeon]